MVFARGHMSSLKFYAVLFSRGERYVPCLGFNEGISWKNIDSVHVCMKVCIVDLIFLQAEVNEIFFAVPTD